MLWVRLLEIMVSGECVGLDTDVESNEQISRREKNGQGKKCKAKNLTIRKLVVQGHFT